MTSSSWYKSSPVAKKLHVLPFGFKDGFLFLIATQMQHLTNNKYCQCIRLCVINFPVAQCCESFVNFPVVRVLSTFQLFLCADNLLVVSVCSQPACSVCVLTTLL